MHDKAPVQMDMFVSYLSQIVLYLENKQTKPQNPTTTTSLPKKNHNQTTNPQNTTPPVLIPYNIKNIMSLHITSFERFYLKLNDY